jgi:hypothetical protein
MRSQNHLRERMGSYVRLNRGKCGTKLKNMERLGKSAFRNPQ